MLESAFRSKHIAHEAKTVTDSRSPNALARTLLVDADDTLWENSIYYLECAQRFQEYMAALGCDLDAALRALRAAELEAVPAHGYGPQGFVSALGMACCRLLADAGQPATHKLIADARIIGDAVLDIPIVLLPGVATTLVALRPSTWLILVTKGERAVQGRKLERSGLAGLFDAVYIEHEKHAALYRRIVDEQALDSARTWMAGNSPRSDINEAVRAGLPAIFIPHSATWVGELAEIESPDQVVTLHSFAELLTLFEIPPQG